MRSRRTPAESYIQCLWRVNLYCCRLKWAPVERACCDHGLVKRAERCPDGPVRLRPWKHFEGNRRQDAELTESTHHQLGEVKARSVLHDTSPAPEQFTAAVDELHSEDEVPDPSELKPSRAAQASRDRSTDRSSRRTERGIEGQMLAVLAEQVVE